MTDKELKRANEIKSEINSLRCFIHTLKCCHKGEIKAERQRVLFQNIPYGAFNEVGSIELSQDMTLRTILLLEDHLQELENEFKKIGAGKASNGGDGM